MLGGNAKNLAFAVAALAGDDLLAFQFENGVSENFKALFRENLITAVTDIRTS